MNNIIVSIILTCLLILNVHSQTPEIKEEYFVTENGVCKKYTGISSVWNVNRNFKAVTGSQVTPYGGNTQLRWSLMDPYSVGQQVFTDGMGVNTVNGWFLNNPRVSIFGNSNNIPVWEYQYTITAPFHNNYVSISRSGSRIAAGHYTYFYVFNRDSAVPFFSFNASSSNPNHKAHNVSLSSDGEFLIAVSQPWDEVDSAVVYGFSTLSTVPVWQKKIFSSQPYFPMVTGLKLSGNDSVFILSTFYRFYVMETFTGNILYSGNIGPNANSNTQENQGINNDGSVISTASHDGYLTVYRRSGNSYTQQWRYKNTDSSLVSQWITVSDITSDGKYVACGTLDWRWVGGWIYDGQVKFFDIEQGPVPRWEYKHMGDMVTSVSFSKSGNILSACTWGSIEDTGTDIVIFKSSVNTNLPIFSLGTPGSMLYCNTSENGGTVTVTGKKVHARTMGNGGLLYNIFVDTNDNPIGINQTGTSIPADFSLYQNYPNPFNPMTKIKFDVISNVKGKVSNVKLTVFDVLGKEVQVLVNQQLSPGTYEVDFDGSDLPSGVYFYRLNSSNFIETKRMVLMK